MEKQMDDLQARSILTDIHNSPIIASRKET